MKTFLQVISLVVTMLIFSAGVAICASGTFYTNSEAYHGPDYVDLNGIIKASCNDADNNKWVYESDHFLVYCDLSSDANCSRYAGMAETEFASVKVTLGITTDGELGISTTVPSTKPHICSDWNSEGASGNSSGISMPALDESNTNMFPLDRLHDFAGYRNTIRHEMIHLFQSTLAADTLVGDKLELWFTEGLAVFIAHHSILMDTTSLADYYALGRPNPVAVKTRPEMGGLTNNKFYPAFGLAVKYLFDSAARGGAGNSMSKIKVILDKIKIGGAGSFPVAFGTTFTRAGTALPLADYTTNFQIWMNTYLSNLETPGTVTGGSGIEMVGVFPNNTGCDMISGDGAIVTPSGNFTLNVSELADGYYANSLCFMGGDFSTIYGPGGFTVSGGKLSPTSYDITQWPSSCLALSPPSRSLSYSGGTGDIAVIPLSGVCPWTAVSDAAWITITSTLGEDGTGIGTVSYSVAENTTANVRTGTITIAGLKYSVEQGVITRGNINSDGKVDLSDAILGLKIMAGNAAGQTINIGADVNNDGKIGLAEVIYILQKVAQIR
jgi:hypothetical protein